MNNRAQRPELYFVLYLLALLLLLSEPKAPDTGPVALSVPEPPVEFFLDPSEPRCIIADSAGHRSVQVYDSVVTLRSSRRLEQARISLQLDSAGQLLWSSEEPTSWDPITAELSADARRFLLRWHFHWWNPKVPPGEHTYRLRVRVDYTLDGIRHTERLQLPLRISIFRLPADESRGGEVRASPPPMVPLPPPSPLRIVVPDTLLEVPPFGRWAVELTVFGVEDVRRDLASIDIRPAGSATLTPKDASTLLLRGKAPREGVQQVGLTIARRSDGKTASVQVTTVVQPLPPAEVPEELYPERSYRLDPRLRFSGQDTRAEVRDGSVLLSSSPGTPLTVRVRLPDTGKTLLLRRFLNEELLDETPLPVRDFPAPEVVSVRWDGTRLIVRTRCFGTVEDTPNECRCELLLPSGRVRELRGDLRRLAREPYGLVVEQSFALEGVEPSAQLRLVLHDRAGRSSHWSGRALPR